MESIGHRIVADDYRINGDRPVAYVDESYSAPNDSGSNFYILTAVVVEQAARDGLRSGIEHIAGDGWWHTTEVLQRPDGLAWVSDMLGYLSEGTEVSVVALDHEVDEDDVGVEEARRACFERLFPALEAGSARRAPVSLALLEARRDRKQRNRDEYLHSQLIKAGMISDGFKIRSVSPRDEHLLWLPDTVCSAVRRQVVRQRDDLLSIVESSIEWV